MFPQVILYKFYNMGIANYVLKYLVEPCDLIPKRFLSWLHTEWSITDEPKWKFVIYSDF